MIHRQSVAAGGPRPFLGPFLAMVASDSGRDFLMMLADRAARMLVGVFMAGLTARYLGTEVFGWLNYAGAIAAFGTAVAHLGFDGIVVRELVRQPSRAGMIMGAVLVYRTAVGLLLALGLVLSAGWLGEGERIQVALIRILALGTLAPALGSTVFWFQAQTNSRVALVWALPPFLVSAGVRWWLITVKAPVEALAWASLLEMLGSGLLTGWAMMRRGGKVELVQPMVTGRALLAESWPLLAGALAAAVYMRIDMVMLKWLVDDTAVGLYAAASRFSEMAYAIPSLAGASIMAKLTAAATTTVDFDQVIDRYFRASARLGYLFCLPGIFLAPWLMELIFGDAFAAAGTIVRIHVLTVLFVCLSVARGRVLIIRGYTRFAMCTAISGGVINIILNLLLIPRWGAQGAAVASVISHAFAAVGITLLYAPVRDLGRAQMRALAFPGWKLSL